VALVATAPPAAATPGPALPAGFRRRHAGLRRAVDVDRGLTPASADHDDVGRLRRRIALPVHGALGDVDEIARTGLNPARATRPELHQQCTSKDIDCRLVLTVMMPTGHHAGLRATPDHMLLVATAC
jgi:hypothetical protein